MLTTLLAQAAELGPDGFLPSEGYGAELVNITPCESLEIIISNTIGFITVLASIIFIVYFIWGSIDWIASGGDSGKVGNARNKMTQGVIGLILIVASYGMIGLIGTVTGLNILDLCEQVQKITPGEDSKSGTSVDGRKCFYPTEFMCKIGEDVDSCTADADGCYAPN